MIHSFGVWGTRPSIGPAQAETFRTSLETLLLK